MITKSFTVNIVREFWRIKKTKKTKSFYKGCLSSWQLKTQHSLSISSIINVIVTTSVITTASMLRSQFNKIQHIFIPTTTISVLSVSSRPGGEVERERERDKPVMLGGSCSSQKEKLSAQLLSGCHIIISSRLTVSSHYYQQTVQNSLVWLSYYSYILRYI